MNRALLVALAPLVLFASCSSNDASAPAATTAATDAGTSDATDETASSTDGSLDADASEEPDADTGPKLPDPSTWDCTRTKEPDRVATTPFSCLLDPTCKPHMVSAHRGAGGQLGKIAPEDTLAAYRAGIAIGVDFVETDPRPTKDGVLVNIHDPTVDRTTDGTGTVSDMTFDEVRALHVKASQFAGDYSCEKVPTLEELLTTCKDKAVVLVDANKTDRVDLLVAAIQKTGTIDSALFDTSSQDKIDQALAMEPTLHFQYRTTGVDDLNAALDHWSTHAPTTIEIESSADPKAVAQAAHARGQRVLLDAFAQDTAYAASGDTSNYQMLYDVLGIDVVQTDRPEIVLHLLGRL